MSSAARFSASAATVMAIASRSACFRASTSSIYLLALGLGLLAHRHDGFLGLDGGGTGLVGLRLCLRLVAALVGDGDLAVLFLERHGLLLLDRQLLELALGLDPRLLHLAIGDDLRLLGQLLLRGLLLCDLRLLEGSPRLDLAFLSKARVLLLPADFELLALRRQVLLADRHRSVLLDVVSLLPASLDLLRELRQSFGVEGVVRVEDTPCPSGPTT